MNFQPYIKEIGRGAEGSRNLSRDEAQTLYGALLDGEVPDLELGALLIALRVKGESPDEMQGFLAAIDARLPPLPLPPGDCRPVVLPSYNGGRKEANLTPLLALLLQHFGVPVLVHGLVEDFGRVTTARVFAELGVKPQTTLAETAVALAEKRLAFAPLPLLSPGLSQLLALRQRLGVRNSAHSLVKLLDPWAGGAVLVAAATHPAFIDLMRELMLARGQRGLLLRATEGEPFANPKRQPRLEYIRDGKSKVLFAAERDSLRELPDLPASNDAPTTARWIERVVDRKIPLPRPIADQLLTLLVVSGRVEDWRAAQAILALDTIRL